MCYHTALFYLKFEKQNAYRFLIILNQLLFQHFLTIAFKINVHVNRYFAGLPSSLETNALPYGITTSETQG